MKSTFNTLKLKFGFFAISLLLVSCSSDSSLQYEVSNTNDFDTENAEAIIDVSGIVLPEYFTITNSDGNTVPFQVDDLDKDGNADELFLQLSLSANSSTTLTISETSQAPSFSAKTDITIKVRDEKDLDNMQVSDDFESVESYTEPFDFKQDNGLIFLEGPGWESNLVGYRFYFDDRNRFDIFGKSTQELSLANINETYHERRDWGADVLKVSSTFGIGSPALFKDGKPYLIEKTESRSVEVLANGPLRSIMKVSYPGWDVDGEMIDAEMFLEIHANHRYTELSLKTDKEDADFSTGLVKHPNISSITRNSTSSYSYGFTWGNQTDLDEGLGMALIFPESVNPNYEGNLLDSYAYSMNTNGSEVSYRFLAAWELEPENVRINSANEFESYIKAVAQQWQNPLIVTKK